ALRFQRDRFMPRHLRPGGVWHPQRGGRALDCGVAAPALPDLALRAALLQGPPDPGTRLEGDSLPRPGEPPRPLATSRMTGACRAAVERSARGQGSRLSHRVDRRPVWRQEHRAGRHQRGRSAVEAAGVRFWYATDMDTLLSRITIDPAVCHGKPCVR